MWNRLGKCPVCGSPLSETLIVDPETGEPKCRVCGYVLEELVFDMGPEWRAFTPEDRMRRSRVGAPLTSRIHDNALTTYISRRTKDPRYRKLAALQHQVRTSGKRGLVALLQEFNNAVSKLGLPQRVAETAAKILRKLESEGVVRRSNATAYIAAAIYIASRIDRHPIPKRELMEKLGVSERELWRASMKIREKISPRAAPPRPQMFVPRIVAALGLPGEVEALANRFATLLVKTGLAQGKPPEALAAAAVYLASILLDEKRNQEEVAKAVKITDATIRSRYRDILDNFYIEVRL